MPRCLILPGTALQAYCHKARSVLLLLFFFFRMSKMSFYTVLDQEHLRTIKNIHFFEQNELANIELNIPKSFSLNFKPLTGPSL